MSDPETREPPTKTRRERMIRDSARMRRVRWRYVSRAASWLEADRDRIDALASRMKALGLYAPTTSESDARMSIVGYLARDAVGRNFAERRRWLLKTGWIAYWGWSNSRAKRSRRLGLSA